MTLTRKLVFSQVLSEPIVNEAGNNGLGEMRGDWSVQGFWVPQRVAVFDTHSLIGGLIPSYETLALDAAFISTGMKRKNYIRLK